MTQIFEFFYKVGAGKDKTKLLKLELSCKNNMFYPKSRLFKCKRRGKIDGYVATYTSKLKWAWQA